MTIQMQQAVPTCQRTFPWMLACVYLCMYACMHVCKCAIMRYDLTVVYVKCPIHMQHIFFSCVHTTHIFVTYRVAFVCVSWLICSCNKTCDATLRMRWLTYLCNQTCWYTTHSFEQRYLLHKHLRTKTLLICNKTGWYLTHSLMQQDVWDHYITVRLKRLTRWCNKADIKTSMCAMTHSFVQQDVWDHLITLWVRWLIRLCNKTDNKTSSYLSQDFFTCIHTSYICDTSHLYMWVDSFVCTARRVRQLYNSVCEMTRSFLWQDVSHMCTHLIYLRHIASLYVSWLIRLCNKTCEITLYSMCERTL